MPSPAHMYGDVLLKNLHCTGTQIMCKIRLAVRASKISMEIPKAEKKKPQLQDFAEGLTGILK